MRAAGGPTIVYLTATSPWPTTNGGRKRTALTLEALTALCPTHLLIAPPRPTSVELPERMSLASTTVLPVALPRLWTRIAHRGSATLIARHPYVVRWQRAGGPARLHELIESSEATIVILEFPFYPAAAAAARATGAKIVADVADERVAIALSAIRTAPSIITRMLTLLDHRALRRSERSFEGIDQIWYVTEVDADAARLRHPRLDVRVVPNAVDAHSLERLARGEPPPPPRSAAFLGSFDYLPNEQAGLRFVTRIAPLLRSEVGEDPVLAIIGRAPSARLREAAAANRVQVHADVPDAARTLLGFGTLVVPLSTAAGTRLKILEALGLGVPVVTTQIGVAGLDLVVNEHFLLGETDEELAACVLRLWHEPDLAARLRAAGQEVVQARHSFDSVLGAVAAAISGLSSGRGADERDGRTDDHPVAGEMEGIRRL